MISNSFYSALFSMSVSIYNFVHQFHFLRGLAATIYDSLFYSFVSSRGYLLYFVFSTHVNITAIDETYAKDHLGFHHSSNLNVTRNIHTSFDIAFTCERLLLLLLMSILDKRKRRTRYTVLTIISRYVQKITLPMKNDSPRRGSFVNANFYIYY